jgi:hypothetical protein
MQDKNEKRRYSHHSVVGVSRSNSCANSPSQESVWILHSRLIPSSVGQRIPGRGRDMGEYTRIQIAKSHPQISLLVRPSRQLFVEFRPTSWRQGERIYSINLGQRNVKVVYKEMNYTPVCIFSSVQKWALIPLAAPTRWDHMQRKRSNIAFARLRELRRKGYWCNYEAHSNLIYCFDTRYGAFFFW